MDVCLLWMLCVACDELITRPEESYRLWCVIVRNLETSRMRRSWPALGRSATKKKISVIIYSCVPTIYLIHFSDYIIDQHNGDDSPQSNYIIDQHNEDDSPQSNYIIDQHNGDDSPQSNYIIDQHNGDDSPQSNYRARLGIWRLRFLWWCWFTIRFSGIWRQIGNNHHIILTT